jgi:hypothetical protein
LLDGKLGVVDTFPERPKGMHTRRYNRLRLLHGKAVQDSLGMLAAYTERLASRLMYMRLPDCPTDRRVVEFRFPFLTKVGHHEDHPRQALSCPS